MHQWSLLVVLLYVVLGAGAQQQIDAKVLWPDNSLQIALLRYASYEYDNLFHSHHFPLLVVVI